MPERSESDLCDRRSSTKALAIFGTLRSNLAMVMSFARRSFPSPPTPEEYDLGFLGIQPGENQMHAYTYSMHCILIALVSQCLDNYQELKEVRPELKDAELEGFLDDLGDREKFLSGMAAVRNAAFHLRDTREWDRDDVAFFGEVCDQRGGVAPVVDSVLDHLYDFTSRCFQGKLQIRTRFAYDRMAESNVEELQPMLEASGVSLDDFRKPFDDWGEAGFWRKEPEQE